MAGYNPLNYFSFGKKKDVPTGSEDAVEEVSPQEQDIAGARESTDAAHPADTHERVSDTSGQPLLRVVKGNPTDEEIAALTALVAAHQASQVQQEQNSILTAASRLLNRRQRLGASLRPGPGSWRRARPM